MDWWMSAGRSDGWWRRDRRSFRLIRTPISLVSLPSGLLEAVGQFTCSAPTRAESRISQSPLMNSYLAELREVSFLSPPPSLLFSPHPPLPLPFLQSVLSFLSVVLGMGLRGLHILGKHVTTQLHLIFPVTDFFSIDMILLCSPG